MNIANVRRKRFDLRPAIWDGEWHCRKICQLALIMVFHCMLGANQSYAQSTCSNVFSETAGTTWIASWAGYSKLPEGMNSSPFVSVFAPARVDLASRFAYIFDDHFAHLTWGRKDSEGGVLGTKLMLHVYRDIPGPELDKRYVGRPIRATDLADAKTIRLNELQTMHQDMFSALYGSYAEQSLEIAREIGHYREQDETKKHLATHFMLSLNVDKPIGHIQALRKAELPLNLEEEFGVQIVGGDRTFEIGRERILRNADSGLIAESLTGDKNHPTILRLLLYQKLFAWLNSDVHADAVVMHVSPAMKRLFEKSRSPFRFTQKASLNPRKGGPQEWVLVMERKELLDTEEFIFKEILLARARYALSLEDATLSWSLRPNERAVARRVLTIPTSAAFDEPSHEASLVFNRAYLTKLVADLENFGS